MFCRNALRSLQSARFRRLLRFLHPSDFAFRATPHPNTANRPASCCNRDTEVPPHMCSSVHNSSPVSYSENNDCACHFLSDLTRLSPLPYPRRCPNRFCLCDLPLSILFLRNLAIWNLFTSVPPSPLGYFSFEIDWSFGIFAFGISPFRSASPKMIPTAQSRICHSPRLLRWIFWIRSECPRRLRWWWFWSCRLFFRPNDRYRLRFCLFLFLWETHRPQRHPLRHNAHFSPFLLR